MLSRAVCAPRVCLSSRLGLVASSRSAAAGAAARRQLPRLQSTSLALRAYSSNSLGVAQKKRVEALISGNEPLDSSRRRRRKSPRRRHDDDGPEWELLQPETATVDAVTTDQHHASAQTSQSATVKGTEAAEYDPVEGTEPLPPIEEPPAPTQPGSPDQRRSVNHFRDRLFDLQRVNAEALGRPIDTLVIRDPDMLRRKGGGRKMVIPTDSTDQLDWRSLLEPATPAEVDAVAEALANIEELRPIDLTIPRRQLNDLIDSLSEGFTKDQLSMYHGQADDPKTSPSSHQIPKYDWLAGCSSWKSASQESVGAESPKKRLARAIVTSKWNIQAQEEVGGLGLTEIHVNSRVYGMLTSPSIGASAALTLRHLSPSIGEAITPYAHGPHSGTVHLHTRKSIVPGILSFIDELSQRMVTKDIPLDDLSDQSDFRPEFWEGLSRRTGTLIEYQRGLKNLEVKEQITTRRLKSKAKIIKAGRLVPHYRESRGMSWRDKLHQWSRFVLPASVPGELKAKHLKFPSNVEISWPSEAGARAVVDTVGVAGTRSSVRAGEGDRITATFGHILHHKTIPITDAAAESRRRIMSPVVPHPASFTDFLPEYESDLKKQLSIVLDFVPAPNSSKGGPLPEVRLTLPIVNDADYDRASLTDRSSLRAVQPIFTTDLLVPDEVVDVRIHRQREIPLDLSLQDSLRAFIDASELVMADGRLKTPSRTMLVLPIHLFPVTPEGEDVSDNNNNNNTNNTNTNSASYLFAGLNVHETVELAWKGCTLRYDSIEADRHDGTHQQLSLECDGTQDRAHFLKLLELAVEGKYWSWNKGVSQVRELPEDVSEGELRKQTLQEDDAVYGEEGDDSIAGEEEHGDVHHYHLYDANTAPEQIDPTVEETVQGDDAHPAVDDECRDVLGAGDRLALSVEDQLQVLLRDKSGEDRESLQGGGEDES
ncbi:hypothetical protein GMORB2_5220 [Geosmithia morbida]|uniref:Mitochondrial inner-membrane-bound regulator-domain-containing protein n=1 Tax=Geosmithia morbida TaxID=1094350 RepID=A0A9P4YZC6_9HYPO|nr:uncharacterized protein GMORB2_5220 [Geosmithia morbida]KAF4124554.1 hypothetical protein GMORB2_5220 [Geosmithia morbida]